MRNDTTSSRRPRRLALLLAVCCALGVVAVARWQRDVRRQRALQNASLEELVAASKQDTANPQVFHLLGIRAQEAGQDELALNAFWKAVQLAPDSEADWIRWARVTAKARGADAGLAVLSTYLKDHAPGAQILLERASLYSAANSHRLASEDALAATRLEPNNAAAWNLAGTEALTAHNDTDAETALRRAAALAPADWQIQKDLGRALLALKRNAEALPYLQEALRLAPDRPAASLYLGKGLLTLAHTHQEHETARGHLQTALRASDPLEPDERFRACLMLGQSYQQEADWHASLPWLQRAAQLEPGEETVHFALARSYRALGDAARADEEMRAHQAVNQYHADIRFLLGQINAAPDDATPRLKLARLYARHGDTVDARQTYRSLLARDPASEAARRELAALPPGANRNP